MNGRLASDCIAFQKRSGHVVVYGSSTIRVGSTSPSATNRVELFVPGAANYEHIRRIGHCLFAPLTGLGGALLARWFYRTATS